MKKYTFLFLFFSLFGVLLAGKTVVTSASGVNKTWNAGDTIILRSGIWHSQILVIKGKGSAQNPIVVMAQEDGKVVLTGSSTISFSGSYIHVRGLLFEGQYSGTDHIVNFRTSSSDLAYNCRLSNCAIKSYNPSSSTVDTKWISLYGSYNRVDSCFFENKTNAGTLLVVWLKEGTKASHTIDHNYFSYRNANLDSDGKELNGQEIIRIGDSSTSMLYADCQVMDNYFERCDGEIEVISNKSCGNIYKNNCFYECSGMLTLRHGNDCLVEGNYFIGNGKKNSGGIRIIGQGHRVYNNYMQDLTGNSYRSAICMVRGKPNSALNEYFQVKDADVQFNTIVNCSVGFALNYNSDPEVCTLPPVGCKIANNHIYNTSSSVVNIYLYNKSDPDLDITYRNNLMNMGKYTNISLNGSQIITGKDAKMILNREAIPFWEPVNGSALFTYQTTDLPTLSIDIRGRIREGNKSVGASEIEGIPNLQMPNNRTGPSWIGGFVSVEVASVVTQERLGELWTMGKTSAICFLHPEDLHRVAIYNSGGVLLWTKELSGVHRWTLPPLSENGLYFIRLESLGRCQHLKWYYDICM